METTKIKKPKLRFPDFQDFWKKEPLKNLTKINQGLQIPISQRLTEKVDNSYFYITNEFLKEASKKQYYIIDPPKSVLCSESDILMTRTGNTGMVVTNVSGAFHNNFFKIKYSDKLDKEFLFYFLTLYNTQNLILRLAGISTIPDLNHSDFYRIEIPFPKKQEQQKIATFLSSVDKKIDQLQKKKELLEQYKKGMMQKIFKQEIRFKDENGKNYPDWRKWRLKDLGEFKNGINKSKSDFGKGYPFINLMDVFGKNTVSNLELGLVNVSENERKLYNIQYGDILFVRSSVKREGVGLTSLILRDFENTVYSGFLIRFRPISELNLDYKKYCFHNPVFRRKLIALSTTSANTNINQESLSQLNMDIPCIKEQVKIANFLSAIDDKIDLVATEIDKTKQFKQGLLQQMFV